ETPPQDARIDDVIESLSQALGAAIQQPQEPASDDPASTFEDRRCPRSGGPSRSAGDLSCG
ncbi:MAG: hypothetical protein EOO66_20290, partial [Methylobacterium sp.]